MRTMNCEFTVIELGKSAAPADIKIPETEPVEVVDMMSRKVLHINASTVSMYRHTLRWQGKSYSIINIRKCA